MDTLEQAYSLASGHFLTDYIPLELLEDDDHEAVDKFIMEHKIESLENLSVEDIWELVEGVGMDYYKLTNSTVKP